MVSSTYEAFVERTVKVLADDPRVAAIGLVGSWSRGQVDEFSDLDFVVVAAKGASDALLADRRQIAAALGPLLSAFTGEHVGEPHLLIALYGPPALHVDLKFLTLEDLETRTDEPAIVWDRDGAARRVLERTRARFPSPDLQWIEDRFWVWIHYGATKLGRGELFEALDTLALLRARVLGPLALMNAGQLPMGLRRFEHNVPAERAALVATAPAYDPRACGAALGAAAAMYRRVRERVAEPTLVRRIDAERIALEYLEAVVRRL